MTIPKEKGVNVAIIASDGKYRVAHFENLRENKRVVLKPGIPMEFRIKNLPKLPDNLRFQVSFYNRGGGRNWWESLSSSRRTVYLADTETISTSFPGPAKYIARLNPMLGGNRNNRNNRRMQMGRQRLEFELDVKEVAKDGAGSKPQTFEIELDEGELELIKELIEEAKEAGK